MVRITKNRRRGITLIETLAATLIVSVAVFGSISIFYTATNMTGNTARSSIAESLVREAVEQVHNQGFQWCTNSSSSSPCDGTVTAYFDANGEPTVAASAKYTVVTTVVSSALTSGVPNNTALRTVTVTASNSTSGAVYDTSGTYLTWGGI